MAEFDNAGDMLILEPEKPKQHLANLNLGKIVCCIYILFLGRKNR